MHVLAAIAGVIAAQPEPGEPLAPEQVLAIRLEQERLAQRVIPTVVIVEDAPSYAAAISAWDGSTRFPVLWDDGSVRARADIARFVRGFGPEAVVRFESGDAAWPGERAARTERIERALFEAVFDGALPGSMRAYCERLRAAGAPLVGIVMADPDDAGWAGALALGAGHFQPIGFTRSADGLSDSLNTEEAAAIERAARDFAGAMGLSWEGPADEVDAVTIAFDCPAKVLVSESPSALLATTDVLGRSAPGSATRWAWAGQIDCPNEARAVYVAMCSLFLSDKSAWVFDGYPEEPSWATFDGTLAAQKLVGGGWATAVFDVPRNGLTVWRAACARQVDAGLVLVNTMGNADFFRLNGADASPGDVPMLARPAGVHFVHSFSAARLGNADTVGGRWLEHGAYAYAGSVQEPTLAAFVATPLVAERLAAGYPFGVSVRHRSEPWRVATIGDPLATFHASGAREAEAEVPLEGVRELGPMARDATGGERFAEAIGLFALCGEDDSAARLAGGLLRDRPEAFDAEVARAALLPLFRAGKPEEVVACFGRLSPRDRREVLFLDALWHAGRLRMFADQSVLSVLRQNLRRGQAAADAIELAEAWTHTHGSHSAVGMLQSVLAETRNRREQRQLDKRINEMLRGG